jgi:hypothetical protein
MGPSNRGRRYDIAFEVPMIYSEEDLLDQLTSSLLFNKFKQAHDAQLYRFFFADFGKGKESS